MIRSRFLNRLMNATVGSLLRRARILPDPERGVLGQIPQITLEQILSGRPIIRVDGSYSYVPGSLPWPDIVALLSIAVDRAPKSVVEIGTLHGHTTRLLALNLPECEIHTIDLPEDPDLTGGELQKDDFHLIAARRLGQEYRSDPSIRNVTQHLGDTATLPFPPAELFYIDGSHTYDYARNDTEKALVFPEAKTILWHDCDATHPGVISWLREMTERGYPVRRIKGTNLAVLYR